MKLYIAGSSAPSERPRIDAAFAVARELVMKTSGFVIVGDWRPAIDKYGANAVSRDIAAESALDDLRAIRSADIFWLLISETSRCAWVELGYALGLSQMYGRERLRVVCSGRQDVSIFSVLANRLVETDEEAFRIIRGYVEGT